MAPEKDDYGPVTPRETALNFEAMLIAVRASRDGVRITLQVHPQEPCIPAFLEVGINKRLVCSAVAIGDNEEIDPPLSVLEGIKAVRKAGIVCRDEDFHAFAVGQGYMEQRSSPEENEEAAKLFMRSWCRVRSRSDLRYDRNAQARFEELLEEFNAWRRAHYWRDESRSVDGLTETSSENFDFL